MGWMQAFSIVDTVVTVYGVFIACTTKMATVWVTVLVAVNRYIVVCRPPKASQWCTISKVKIQLAVMLVLAVVSSIPHLFRYRIKYYARNNGTSYGIDVGMISEWGSFYNVYDTVVIYGLVMVVPLCILTLLTICLIKAMKAHRRRPYAAGDE